MSRWTIVLPDSGPKVSSDIWRGGSSEAYDFVLNAMGNNSRERIHKAGKALLIVADIQPMSDSFSSDSTDLYMALGARVSE